MSQPTAEGRWTFVTNHALVLLGLAQDKDARVRDLAERAGITERAAQRIVGELVAAGYVEKRRVGRRNTYQLRAESPLRHPDVQHATVAQLLSVLERPASNGHQAHQ